MKYLFLFQSRQNQNHVSKYFAFFFFFKSGFFFFFKDTKKHPEAQQLKRQLNENLFEKERGR